MRISCSRPPRVRHRNESRQATTVRSHDDAQSTHSADCRDDIGPRIINAGGQGPRFCHVLLQARRALCRCRSHRGQCHILVKQARPIGILLVERQRRCYHRSGHDSPGNHRVVRIADVDAACRRHYFCRRRRVRAMLLLCVGVRLPVRLRRVLESGRRNGRTGGVQLRLQRRPGHHPHFDTNAGTNPARGQRCHCRYNVRTAHADLNHVAPPAGTAP